MEKNKHYQKYNSNDDRITCSQCKRKIVPRISFKNGEPDKSYCPYCGIKIEEFPMSFDDKVKVIAFLGGIVFFLYLYFFGN